MGDIALTKEQYQLELTLRHSYAKQTDIASHSTVSSVDRLF